MKIKFNCFCTCWYTKLLYRNSRFLLFQRPREKIKEGGEKCAKEKIPTDAKKVFPEDWDWRWEPSFHRFLSAPWKHMKAAGKNFATFIRMRCSALSMAWNKEFEIISFVVLYSTLTMCIHITSKHASVYINLFKNILYWITFYFFLCLFQPVTSCQQRSTSPSPRLCEGPHSRFTGPRAGEEKTKKIVCQSRNFRRIFWDFQQIICRRNDQISCVRYFFTKLLWICWQFIPT